MIDFFLNPDLVPHPAGLAAVQPTINAVQAFRAAGVKIVWLQVRTIFSLVWIIASLTTLHGQPVGCLQRRHLGHATGGAHWALLQLR